MTARLHDVDGYRVEFLARITKVAARYLLLDQTYFFGPHGLLVSDVGTIDGHRVCGLSGSPEVGLAHVLREAIDQAESGMLSVGDLVECVIDWPRRYSVMKLHTVQHLVDLAARATHGVRNVVLGAVTSTSAEMAIEFHSPAVDCPAILQWLDGVIDDDLACTISTAASPPFGPVWHLDGLGQHRCDALHLCTTSEVDDVVLFSRQLQPSRLAVVLRTGSEEQLAAAIGSRTRSSNSEHRGGYRLGQRRGPLRRR